MVWVPPETPLSNVLSLEVPSAKDSDAYHVPDTLQPELGTYHAQDTLRFRNIDSYCDQERGH